MLSIDLLNDMKSSRLLLPARGDEMRLKIVISIIEHGCFGSKAQDIADDIALSRQTTLSHLIILKEASVVKTRKEGRVVYYYLDPDRNMIESLYRLAKNMKEAIDMAPKRSGE